MSEEIKALVLRSQSIIARIMDSGGELSPEIEKELAAIDAKIPAAVDASVDLLDRLSAESSYFKAKAEYYNKYAKACAQAFDTLRANIKDSMILADQQELKGKDFRFTIQRTKPALAINEEVLDPAYFKEEVVRRPDKKRIEEDLKAGVPIEGAMFVESKSLKTSVNPRGDK